MLAKDKKHYIAMFLLGVALISVLARPANAEQGIPLEDSAVAAIQAADNAGAETADLVERLNTALQEINSLGAQTCLTTEGCSNNIDQTMKSIQNEANIRRDQAIGQSYVNVILSQVLAVIGALVGGLGVLFFYRYRSLIQWNRYLRIKVPTKKVGQEDV